MIFSGKCLEFLFLISGSVLFEFIDEKYILIDYLFCTLGLVAVLFVRVRRSSSIVFVSSVFCGLCSLRMSCCLLRLSCRLYSSINLLSCLLLREIFVSLDSADTDALSDNNRYKKNNSEE